MICAGEELFTPDSPHNHMSLNGVEIITNCEQMDLTVVFCPLLTCQQPLAPTTISVN